MIYGSFYSCRENGWTDRIIRNPGNNFDELSTKLLHETVYFYIK